MSAQTVGKRVTCPHCRKTLTVPDGAAKRKLAPAHLPSPDISDLLDEVESAKETKEQPIARACSNCGTTVYGKVISCPYCNRRMPIPAPAAQESTKTNRRHAQWMVGVGLSLVYYSLMLTIGAFLLVIVGAFARAEKVVFFAWLLSFAVGPMALLGKSLCLAIPCPSGQKFVMLAVFADALALFLSFNPSALDPGIDRFPNELIGNIASLAGFLLFLMFLRTLCARMKQSGLSQAAEELWRYATLLALLPPFAFILMMVTAPLIVIVNPILHFLMMVGEVIISIVLLIRVGMGYFNLLSHLKTALLR